MQKTITIHIGLPKTGTTFMQCYFETNRDYLKSLGIYVPKTGQLVGRDHNLLALALQPERWHQFPNEIVGKLPTMWEDLINEIEGSSAIEILLTSEAFSWELNTDQTVKQVRNLLASYTVKIVFCSRNELTFLTSIYKHLIRTGRTQYSIPQMLNEFNNQWKPEFYFVLWGQFFGQENVLELHYDKIKGEMIHEHFLQAVYPNIEFDPLAFKVPEKLNANTSVTPRFLKFLEGLHELGINTSNFDEFYKHNCQKIIPLDSFQELEKSMSLHLNEHVKVQEQALADITTRMEQFQYELQANGISAVTLTNLLAVELKKTNLLAANLENLQRDESRFLAKENHLNEAAQPHNMTAQNMMTKLNSNFEEILKILDIYKTYIENTDFRTQSIFHDLIKLNRQHSETENLIRLTMANDIFVSKTAGNFNLETEHPIAEQSADHLLPNSTVEGTNLCLPFVQMCIDKLGNDMKFLDIGTGAGGLVAGFLSQGISAMGLDGTDYNKNNAFGYWPIIPDNLKTCDVTHPFKIFDSTTNENKCQFNIITMWEVLEHIDQLDLPQLFQNIVDHLFDNGFFIASVSLIEHYDDNGTNWHPTLMPKQWWEEQLMREGLASLVNHPFNVECFCRGNGPRNEDLYNYRQDPETGFWLVAQKA